MLKDFIEWTKVADTQYTKNNFVRSDSFTFNYESMQSPTGKKLPGYWRQVYMMAYDTDLPICPWEMLGFTVKSLLGGKQTMDPVPIQVIT